MHYANAGMIFYGIMASISLIAAVLILKFMKYPGQQQGFGMKAILPVIIVGAVIGAKLPVIISYGLMPELWWTGKSYFGAILGAFLAMNIYKAAAGIKGNTGDRFVVPLCVAAGIGKIGCLVNGCCSGAATEFFIKIKNHAGVYTHPVQIYESIFEFSAALFFVYLHRTKKLEGSHFLLYVIFYMIFRFLIEFIRIEPRVWLGLTAYQLMSIIFLPVFFVMMYRRVHGKV
jgi:phosphatidylglycerol:prolipoprotein diacylglycerol transferase